MKVWKHSSTSGAARAANRARDPGQIARGAPPGQARERKPDHLEALAASTPVAPSRSCRVTTVTRVAVREALRPAFRLMLRAAQRAGRKASDQDRDVQRAGVERSCHQVRDSLPPFVSHFDPQAVPVPAEHGSTIRELRPLGSRDQQQPADDQSCAQRRHHLSESFHAEVSEVQDVGGADHAERSGDRGCRMSSSTKCTPALCSAAHESNGT